MYYLFDMIILPGSPDDHFHLKNITFTDTRFDDIIQDRFLIKPETRKGSTHWLDLRCLEVFFLIKDV